MNILLTGGNGYIGSHTATVLAYTGHRTIPFDNLSNSKRDVLAESFFSSLKKGRIMRSICTISDVTKSEIFDYI